MDPSGSHAPRAYGDLVPDDPPAVCSRCGRMADGPGLPVDWSFATGRRGLEPLCSDCTRTNLRAIEGRLPEEWWE